MQTLLALGLGYVLGSFPSAYFAAKLKGQDIFSVGSGNMGAMNTARNLGYGLGLLVLVLDMGKGVAASYLGLLLSGPDTSLPALAAGTGAVAGHAWSVFLGFRGGKALATAFGAALPLYPAGALTALVLLVVLSLTLKGRSTLAAFIVIVLYPFIVMLTPDWRASVPTGVTTFFAVALMAFIVASKHWSALRTESRAPTPS